MHPPCSISECLVYAIEQICCTFGQIYHILTLVKTSITILFTAYYMLWHILWNINIRHVNI